ncbi:hypothetical protein [Lacticaseibacillus rhamnosus]|uniref:hypothetical protein n=1 Tax=Lacticaseibacillus rhamnosus TaxID=47715 RepID=UPI0007E17D1B|nr:hypothetical protein [Lacticaseibacillus rhamnosus]OAU12588.1 hypothetical protein PY76_09790 [Lacticaseibacillus rhamnosus]
MKVLLEFFTIHYLSKKGPEKITAPWLDKYYPGLSATRMDSNKGLSQALEIFLTVVHVLEPEKGPKINNFLSEQLPDIENKNDFRQQAYSFLEEVVK